MHQLSGAINDNEFFLMTVYTVVSCTKDELW